ncbi:hypothetical protein ONS95_008277 [Cadophora gregata]|uniref:uncharacterized protein n=1 Tax=Cadophora gregata TaxID=51156 RepID=UPI0026DB5C57|nr:uncharacterized protein ONS95_008277 [Cadophora gregata]KAK0100319.1 hypothetical protein ONS96_007599 [Cadophora gregata f. sp. sojae]KAK0126696.1 hypothetical protein ONS95_008277 [Cadophora gregata]
MFSCFHYTDRWTAVLVAQRELNSTITVSESESRTANLPPCTTTVTSILGEKFTAQAGSCSHTFTVTSTIQPIESKTHTTASETTSSIESTRKSSLTQSAGATPPTSLESISLTSSSTKVEETPAQSPTPSSPTSSTKVDCVATVTSILGEFLVLGTGSCSQTVTIVSTVKGTSILVSTSSTSRTTVSTSSARETQLSISISPTSSSPFTPTVVSTSSISNPSPEPCTATITSTLGTPFLPFQGLCSHTVTVVTSPVQVSPPQAPSTSEEQPPVPINTSVDLGTSTSATISTSTTLAPVPPQQQTESSGPNVGPVNTSSSTTLIITTTTEQYPPPAPETSTSLAPTAAISAPTSQIPQLPNSPSTSLLEGPVGTTSSPLVSATTIHDTQVPLPSSSIEPAPPGCPTECAEPQPTNQPISVSSVSSVVPIQTSIATESQVVSPTSEQGPTTTQLNGITSSEEVSTHLTTPSPSIPTITNTPTPGPIIIGSQTISQDTASNFIFDSQTLVPGSAITVNGQQVSAASGGAIILNPAPPKATPSSSGESSTGPAPAIVVVDGTSITGNTASGFVIGTQTLFPGSAITASGQVITLPLPNPTPAPVPTQTQGPDTIPVILIGSSTFTQNSASAFIIGSQTLSPGSAVTISGQVISLSPTGNAVIVNGATATPSRTTFSTEIQAPITSLVVAGQTLTAGGRVTVGGDVLSLSGGTIKIIGTVTVGGGDATFTATPTGKKKSAGVRVESSSLVYMTVQISVMLGLGALGLF